MVFILCFKYRGFQIFGRLSEYEKNMIVFTFKNILKVVLPLQTCKKMKVIGIIPVRYDSSRFPGKPLASILGKPMIQHVYERASKVLDSVYVATDDKRIYDAVLDFGGNVIFTSKEHENGTSRVNEAVEKIEEKEQKEFTHILNIQGDEPLIAPEQISELASLLSEKKDEMCTLIKEINVERELHSKSEVFVTFSKENYALYFSRSLIPANFQNKPFEKGKYYKHVGLYGFSKVSLQLFCSLQKSKLENSESLEQLRWLENGGKIKLGTTSYESFCVDTEEDLKNVLSFLEKKDS